MSGARAIVLAHEVHLGKTATSTWEIRAYQPNDVLSIKPAVGLYEEYMRNNQFLSCKSHCYFGSFKGWIIFSSQIHLVKF